MLLLCGVVDNFTKTASLSTTVDKPVHKLFILLWINMDQKVFPLCTKD